jgi:hypothetical protein
MMRVDSYYMRLHAAALTGPRQERGVNANLRL